MMKDWAQHQIALGAAKGRFGLLQLHIQVPNFDRVCFGAIVRSK
jgi:hypothetical protein